MNRRDLIKSIVATPALAAVAKAGGDPGTTRETTLKTIEEFRRKSPTLGAPVPNYIEERDHILYDRIHVPAGAMMPENHPLFCSPIGYNRPGSWDFKSHLDTNMVQGNRLPAPQEMFVNRFIFLFTPGMADEDIQAICSRSFWEFQLMQKVIARTPVLRGADEGQPQEWLDNFGKHTVATRSSRLGEEIGLSLVKPIHIPWEAYFSMSLFSEPFQARKDINVYVMQDGLGRFGVQ